MQISQSCNLIGREPCHVIFSCSLIGYRPDKPPLLLLSTVVVQVSNVLQMQVVSWSSQRIGVIDCGLQHRGGSRVER